MPYTTQPLLNVKANYDKNVVTHDNIIKRMGFVAKDVASDAKQYSVDSFNGVKDFVKGGYKDSHLLNKDLGLFDRLVSWKLSLQDVTLDGKNEPGLISLDNVENASTGQVELVTVTKHVSDASIGWKAYSLGMNLVGVVGDYAIRYWIGLSFVKRKKCFKFMQEKMIAVATYLDQVRAVRNIITTTPKLAQNAVADDIAKRIDNIFATSSPKAKKLIKLLETNTFKGNASYFSRLGNVLAAYHLMGDVKDELAPLFLLAGELEAYCAVANLYNRYQSDDVPVDCTFVEFIDNADKPYIKAVDFWNPHVDSTKVVTNSITFGGDHEQNIVVTGINRGGKSTIFGALITDVLFAQSFGIAFAKEFIMTPFAKIGCYMNTMGDVTTGMSTFQAEQLRAQQLCEIIDGLQGIGLTLMFMDELFTGTDPKAGALATCGFAKRLAQFNNAISVFVTHYKEPIELEKQVPGKITNYSVGAIEKQDGLFIPTYKLNKGPSYQNDALQMLGSLIV